MEIAEVIVKLIYFYDFSGGSGRLGAAIRRFVVVRKNKLRVLMRTLAFPPVIRQLVRSSLRPCTDHFHSASQSSPGNFVPVDRPS